MDKTTITLAALALAAVGWQQGADPTPLHFKDGCLLLEYRPALGEARLLLQAESEQGLGHIEVRDPEGVPILKVWSGNGQELSLSGFMVETLESPPASLWASFPEGLYDLRARTRDGRTMLGSAPLSHELLDEPVVTYPYEGAIDVPRNNLLVTWIPDPQATGYHIALEQNENDGLTVRLPPGAGQFQVPDRILLRGTETKLEVGAIGPTGNTTLAEVTFTTL